MPVRANQFLATTGNERGAFSIGPGLDGCSRRGVAFDMTNHGLSGCSGAGCPIKVDHYPEPGCVNYPYQPPYGRGCSPVLWPGVDATARPPIIMNQGLGWARWQGWSVGPTPTYGWNRQQQWALPSPNIAPWRDNAGRFLAPYGGGPLGQANAEEEDFRLRTLIDEIWDMVQAGGRKFARFMVDLLKLKNDEMLTRDQLMRLSGSFYEMGALSDSARYGDDLAIAASQSEERIRKLQTLYDTLANVYRVFPDIGLQGARLGFPPAAAIIAALVPIAKAVVVIIAAYSLWSWLDSFRQQALANRSLADAAARNLSSALDICARQPNSPACVKAIEIAKVSADAAAKGVPPPSGGPSDILSGITKLIGVAAAAFVGLQLLSMFSDERRARRTEAAA